MKKYQEHTPVIKRKSAIWNQARTGTEVELADMDMFKKLRYGRRKHLFQAFRSQNYNVVDDNFIR